VRGEERLYGTVGVASELSLGDGVLVAGEHHLVDGDPEEHADELVGSHGWVVDIE
jgi:hypothetical protein